MATDVLLAALETLRTDAQTIAVVPATRILREIPPAAPLPSLAVVFISDDPQENIANTLRLVFVMDSAPTARQHCETIRQRLRSLFHNRRGYQLGVSPNTINIVKSYAGGTPGGIYQETEDQPWKFEQYYFFVIGDV